MTFRWPHVVGICLLAYLILLNYELARATTESLFLEDYDADLLPFAWFGVAGATLVVVSAYSALAQRIPLARLFVLVVIAAAAVLVLLLWCRRAQVPGSTYLLYIWKDVHIVVVLEMLWTFANATFRIQSARWFYGLFCVLGSSGSLSGGLLVGELAEQGTEATLLWTLPVFGLIAAIGLVATRYAELDPKERSSKPTLTSALTELRRSDYLWWMLGLIVVVQVVITLIDYQYNSVLEATYPDTDERTRVTGHVYAVVSVGAIALQLLSGVLLRFFGVPAILIAVPVVVGAAIAASAAVPRFAVTAALKVSSKTFDYSLFKAAKEILYIPLSHTEKTTGKAAVDMFAYRFAKGGASLLLVLMVAAGLGHSAPWLALGLVLVWLAITVRIVRGYRRKVSRVEEIHGKDDRDPA